LGTNAIAHSSNGCSSCGTPAIPKNGATATTRAVGGPYDATSSASVANRAQRRRHAIGVTVQQQPRHDDRPAARGQLLGNRAPRRGARGEPVQQDHGTRAGRAGIDLRAHRCRDVRFGVVARA
jgi:hypothetical protein